MREHQSSTVETSDKSAMHGDKLGDPAALRRSRNLPLFQNLPDLPSPHARRRWRLHAWLGLLAGCFLIVSIALFVFAAWRRFGA